MTLRKNPRLAYCEYVAPDNSSIAVEGARRKLMESVLRVFPKMLKQLSAEVFPPYEALASSDFKIEEVVWHSRGSAFKELPQNSSLRTELSKWASEYHAEQDWFLDLMLRTLSGWHVAPDWRAELRYSPIGGVTTTLAIGEPFKFDCEGWEMQLRTWAEYSQSVRERFKEHLDQYEAASRKLAESCGLVLAPHKYSSVNLDWFVLYQFARLSSGEIARRAYPNWSETPETAILKGVKAAAKLIGWGSLRTTPGRPNRKIP